MLMMLVRTALWGLAVIGAALAFVWLKDSSGGVTVDLNQRTYGPFTPIEFVAIVVLLAALIWLSVKAFGLIVALVRFAAGDETALSRVWNRSRERRGFDALASGMASLAEGDTRGALQNARKAERLLDRPALTGLLLAQSAEASGDATAARDYYKQLASSPDTAYVGVKGLLAQALNKGETERALKLARHAFELKPKDPDLLARLFDLQCEAKDWEGARRTLNATLRAGAITKDVADRREAVLLVADASAAGDAGEADKAKSLSARALKKSPALVAAAIAVAGAERDEGSLRKAAKTLREAWRREPHPEIAAAFAGLAPDETPAARRKRFGDLVKAAPDHIESKLLDAELALASDAFGDARRIMAPLAEAAPNARALALMAAAEKGDGGDEAVVRGWLAKAIAAPRAPRWTCGNCGDAHDAWRPACERCGAFDALDWREGQAGAASDAAAMAPLMAAEPALDAAPAEDAGAAGTDQAAV